MRFMRYVPLLFVASVDEPSGHTFDDTTVVGGCEPIAFPDKLGIWGSMIEHRY